MRSLYKQDGTPKHIHISETTGRFNSTIYIVFTGTWRFNNGKNVGLMYTGTWNFCEYFGAEKRYRVIGKKVNFTEAPKDIQCFLLREYKEYWKMIERGNNFR